MRKIKSIISLSFLIVLILSLVINIKADDSTSVVSVSRKYIVSKTGSTDFVKRTLSSSVLQRPSAANNYTVKYRYSFKFDYDVAVDSPYELETFRYSLVPSLIGFRQNETSPIYGVTLKNSAPGIYITDGNTFVDWNGTERVIDIGDITVEREDGEPLEYFKASDSLYSLQVSNSDFPNIPPRPIEPDEPLPSRAMDFKGTSTYEYAYIVTYKMPAELIAGYNNYSVGRSETTFSGTINVSLTRPNDYVINKGESILLDTTVSSVDKDGTTSDWYGTFQVKKKGSNDWVDIDPEYMSELTNNTNPEHSFIPDMSYQGAKFRYKYVHKYDDSVVVYSNESNLKIIVPDDGNDNDNNGDNDNKDKDKTDKGKDKNIPDGGSQDLFYAMFFLSLVIGLFTLKITNKKVLRK